MGGKKINILSIKYIKYISNTQSFGCVVSAKYPLASDLSIGVKYTESSGNIYT